MDERPNMRSPENALFHLVQMCVRHMNRVVSGISSLALISGSANDLRKTYAIKLTRKVRRCVKHHRPTPSDPSKSQVSFLICFSLHSFCTKVRCLFFARLCLFSKRLFIRFLRGHVMHSASCILQNWLDIFLLQKGRSRMIKTNITSLKVAGRLNKTTSQFEL